MTKLGPSDRLVLAAIHLTKGIGQAALAKIGHFCLDRNLALTEVWQQPELLAPVISHEQIQNLCAIQSKFSLDWVEHQLKTCNISLLTGNDPEFPEALRDLPSCPYLLYLRGNLALLHAQPKAAVIGTRQITGYGQRATTKISQELIASGITIVSGFMYGVDVCAHQVGIDQKVGTIAVLGYGQLQIYPSHLQPTLDQLLESGGLVISQFALDTAPTTGTFPARNQVVAALSDILIVTEAGSDSGTKITTTCGQQLGRMITAMPGPFDSQLSQGTKDLINQGARLITSGQDVLDLLRFDRSDRMLSKKTLITSHKSDIPQGDQMTVWQALQKGEETLDALVAATSLEVSRILVALTDLELNGAIKNWGEYWRVID